MEISPSSSSSSKREADSANGNNSNCLIALPLFSPPFLHTSKSDNKPYADLHLLFATTASHIVHDFHAAIASTADKFLGLVHDFSSRNPLLTKVFSVSDDFHSFCQTHRRRNYRNMRSVVNTSFAAILPGDSVAGLVVTNGISNFLNIYSNILVARLVLTWFPQAPQAIVSPLSTLCDPYLNIFRGIIPPLGGTLDLSPILAFLVLNALTSTASALPAELPLNHDNSSPSLAPRTSSQEKWMTRFASNKSKTSKSQS